MIAKERIKAILDELLTGQDIFPVYVTVSMTNKITVYIDSMVGIKIEQCIAVSRGIESKLDREEEDFELEVSSPGAAQPFLVLEQYKKHVGKEVEVLYKSGDKIKGILQEASNTEVVIEPAPEKKKKGKKQEAKPVEKKTINYSDIKQTRAVLKIK